MEDFAVRWYLCNPDLAMSMAEPSHWFGGHNSWLTFVGVAAVLVVVLIPFLLFTLYKYCGFRFQFQKVRKNTSIGIDSYGFYLDMLFTHKNDSLAI